MKQDNTEHSDARQRGREDMLKGAVIAAADGRPDMHCLITNISTEGAELSLEPGQRVPDRFTLHVPHTGLAYRAHVRWREDGRIGVEFAGAEPKTRPALKVVG